MLLRSFASQVCESAVENANLWPWFNDVPPIHSKIPFFYTHN